MIVDTLSIAKNLESVGLPRKQAEAFALTFHEYSYKYTKQYKSSYIGHQPNENQIDDLKTQLTDLKDQLNDLKVQLNDLSKK